MRLFLGILLLAFLPPAALSSEIQAPLGMFFSPVDPQTFMEGDYVEALREYEKASQLNLTDASTRIDLARLYTFTREYERAAVQIEAAMELVGEPQADSQQAVSLAKLYMRMGAFDKSLENLLRHQGDDFLKGYCYERLGKYEQALEHFRLMRSRGEEPGDLVSYHVADCLRELGRFEEALEAFNEYREEFPPSVYFSHAEDGILSCYEGMGKYEKAIHLRNEMRKKNPLLEAAMGYYVGKDYESLKDAVRAREEYVKVVSNYPKSRYARLSLEALENSSQSKGRMLYHAGRVHYYGGNYRKAVDCLTSYLKQNPKGKYVRDAKYLRGRCYVKLSRYSDAELSFQQLLRSVASEKERAGYLFDLAKTQDQQGRKKTAEGSYETVARMGIPSLSGIAAYRKGLMQEEEGRLEESYRTYMSVKQGDYADNALFRAGNLAFSMGRMDLAREAFHKLVHLPEDSGFRTAGKYWLARALEDLDSIDSAVLLYDSLSGSDPFGYYGYKSRERLRSLDKGGLRTPACDSDVEAWIRTWAPEAKSLSEDEKVRLSKGLMLLDAGLVDVGVSELERIDTESPLSAYLVARAYSSSGVDHKAISMSRDLIGSAIDSGVAEVPKDLLRLAYPLSFLPSALLALENGGVDPLLVLAVIREESLFLTDAVSAAGAVGLMQIMPRTGEEMSRRSEQGDFRIPGLLDPGTSVSLGSRYLGEQLDEFKNLELAIAAYNAGPVAVRRWKERFGAPPMDQFVERMPYPETRVYVKSVLVAWWIYREIWGAT